MSSFEFDSDLALLLHLEKYLVVQDMRQRAELCPSSHRLRFFLNFESFAIQLNFRLQDVISSVPCDSFLSLLELKMQWQWVRWQAREVASTCYVYELASVDCFGTNEFF